MKWPGKLACLRRACFQSSIRKGSTGCPRNSDHEPYAAQQGLAADNRQLGVPEFGSLLAPGLLWRGADGQRCLSQLKPDPLGGASHDGG